LVVLIITQLIKNSVSLWPQMPAYSVWRKKRKHKWRKRVCLP